MEEREEEIDLIELIKYVLRKWKIWVIAAVIGGLLGCGFSTYKQKQMAFENLGNYLNGIIEKNPEVIDKDKVVLYGNYKALYDKQLLKEEKFIIYKMDEMSVYSATVMLLVTSGVEILQKEGQNFISRINSELTRIAEASGLDCDALAVCDLIESSFSIPALEKISYIKDSYVSTTGILSVNIIAPTEQSGVVMTTEIEKILNMVIRERSVENNCKYVWLEKDTRFGYNNEVTDVKESAIKKREGYLEEMKKIGKTFSKDEKLYCSYYYDKEFAKNYEFGFSKKYPVIGAFVACCIAGIFLCIAFIFNRSIKTSDEVSTLGSKLLAEYVPGSEEYVKSVLKGLEASSILICCGAEVVGAKVLKKTLVGELDVKMVGSLEDNVEAVEAVKNADIIVVLTQLWKTSRDSIIRSREVVQNMGKDICGVITVR